MPPSLGSCVYGVQGGRNKWKWLEKAVPEGCEYLFLGASLATGTLLYETH